MSRDAKIKLMETRQLSLIQNITDLLLTKFSTHFVFPALGHDDLHSRKELSRIWSRWLPAESTGTFEKGAYVSKTTLAESSFMLLLQAATT